MLNIQIQNENVEYYLYEKFKNDASKLNQFVSDFIEKEIIKKDIKISFNELKKDMKSNKKTTLQDLIEEIK